MAALDPRVELGTEQLEDGGGRKNIPSFAGNINIGVLKPEGSSESFDRFGKDRPTPRAPSPSTTTARSTTQRVVESLSLFDRIKSRIDRAKQQKKNTIQTTARPKESTTTRPRFRIPK